MIKVCHMTSAHDPEDIRIFHKGCVSLAKAGYDVYLVQPGDSYEKNGVHLVGLSAPAQGRMERFLYSAKNAYKKALEQLPLCRYCLCGNTDFGCFEQLKA